MVSIATDADHLGTKRLELFEISLERLCFLCASGRAVLGVEKYLRFGGKLAEEVTE